jgi:hypothetical protein
MPHEALTLSPQVMARQLGGETVVLDLRSGMYFGLDEVGSRVWQLIGQGGDLESICEALLAEYDVSAETLRQDVAALIDHLVDEGLIAKA